MFSRSTFVFDVSVKIFLCVGELHDEVDLGVLQSLSEACEHVSHFRRCDEALTFAIERLEALHEVGKSS